MSAQINKDICRSLLKAVYNEGRHDEVIQKVMARDAVNHELAPYVEIGMTAHEAISAFLDLYRSAFPDLQVEIHDMLADGDRVATRWRMRGTHTGPLLGIGASGRRVDVSGIRIDRFAGGKVVETWSSWDVLGMLEQIGALPKMRRTFYPALQSLAAA